MQLLHESGRFIGDDEDHLVNWLAADDASPEAVVLRLPELEEVHLPFEIDLSRIVEYYTP